MIIIAKKKKRAKPLPIHKRYKWKEREYIIKDGYGWSKYSYFSSKKSAHDGIGTVKRAFGRKGSSLMRVIRTKKGYGVFQLSPKEEFRTKASVIRMEGKIIA